MGKRWMGTLVLMLCLAMTAGCGKEQVQALTEPPVVYHEVTFQLEGMVFSEQKVQDGTAPKGVHVELKGLNFAYWTDQAGNRVDPETVCLRGDATFVAVTYPKLESHEPFLFTNDLGFLNHQQPLTAQDLSEALKALASEGAERYFPNLPTGTDEVTVQQLKAILGRFYPDGEVDAAMPENDGTVTRAAFARAMCSLTGRTGEKVSVEPETAFPLDVDISTASFEALMEASVVHRQDPNGVAWQDVELPSGLEPGFVNLDGYLYYVQDNGYFLRNGDVGQLHFGENGRYTSGDQELDDLVAGVLAPILQVNASAEELDVLRAVFDHCVDNYVYMRKGPYAFGATGWEIEDAKEMFTSGYGNCYNFAAIFWALARGMGYEPRAVSGTCTGTDQPHGWVIMEVEGEDYFFDPEWQWAYHDRKEFNKDMFMIPMDKVYWWGYEWVRD